MSPSGDHFSTFNNFLDASQCGAETVLFQFSLAFFAFLCPHGLYWQDVATKDDRKFVIQSIIASFTDHANTVGIEGDFDITGKLKMSRWSSDGFDKKLRFFKSEEFWKEIELVEKQENQVKRITVSWEASQKSLLKKFSFLAEKGERARALQVIEEFDELDMATEEEIEKLLLDHQYLGMKQIQLRYLVRVHGLKRILRLEKVREFADVSNVEFTRLMELKGKCKEHLQMESTRITKSAVEKLFGKFSEKQLDLINRRFPDFRSGAVQNLEQLRAHILMVEDYDSKQKDEVSPYEKMAKFPGMKLSISGGLEVRHLDTTFYEGDQNEIKLNLLKSALFSAQLQGQHLKLTTQQMERCKIMLGAMEKQLQEISSEGLRIEVKTKKELDIAKERLRRKRYRIMNETLLDIEETIGRPAIVAIDKICEDVLVRRRGPLVNILYGRLGDGLQLTNDQEESFRKQIVATSEYLDSQAIEVESEILEMQLESFDAESRKKLKSLLGPSLKKSSPSLIGISIGL